MKKVKAVVNGIHWLNLAAIAAQILGAVPQKPWVMAAQAVLAAFMPSMHGVGHTVAFGGPQTRD